MSSNTRRHVKHEWMDGDALEPNRRSLWLATIPVHTLICGLSDFINYQFGVSSKRVEIRVAVNNRHIRAYGGSGDQAVNQLPNRLSLTSATAIQSGSIIVVRAVSVLMTVARANSLRRLPR